MPEQLAFDWPAGVALGADDFFVTAANAQAYAMLENPGDWPARKLALIGPEGAGKSHLTRIVAAKHGLSLLSARSLAGQSAPQAPHGVIIEDMDQLPPEGEEAAFHLHNALARAGLPLLLSARTPPSRWHITLPDLASRMQATSLAVIADPDDALIAALLTKLFLDRQILPKAEVISYLTKRIERSFRAAADIVARLDAASLASHRNITERLAAQVLDSTAQRSDTQVSGTDQPASNTP